MTANNPNSLPLDYDLIVAGGGTAGSAAAVAAGRRGHRVLLIEEQNCLGGVSTSGGVSEWFASLEGMGDIFDTLIWELDQSGGRFNGKRFFNPENLKVTWQHLADRAGVDILFHASVSGVKRDDHLIRGVEIVSCSQKISAAGKFFIDATGEGDLCFLAGADFMKGDPQEGLMLHMTLTAWMYDTGKLQKPYLPEGIAPIQSKDELPGLGAGWVIDDRRVYMNATKIMHHDPTDPFSLSEAERMARVQLAQIVQYLQRSEFPTYALGGTGSRIGIREGRRIIGNTILTQDQVVNRSTPLQFEDGVAVATSQIDFHSLTKAGDSGWRQKLQPYNIPFRCLVARDFSNLLMAGKCISVDQVVHSSCRMTPTCCAMGQAAGTAVALALESKHLDIRKVSLSELRKTLSHDGLELDPEKHQAFAPHSTCFDEDDDVSNLVTRSKAGTVSVSEHTES